MEETVMPEDVKASQRSDGKTDNYFGGDGKADGPGHGHVVVSENGRVDYAREAARYGGGVSVDNKSGDSGDNRKK